MIPAELCNQTRHADSSCGNISPKMYTCFLVYNRSSWKHIKQNMLSVQPLAGWQLKWCSIYLPGKPGFVSFPSWMWVVRQIRTWSFKLVLLAIHVHSISTSTCVPLLGNLFFWKHIPFFVKWQRLVLATFTLTMFTVFPSKKQLTFWA